MSTTKITVKLYAPLLAAFDRDIEALFLKRDAFLNSMIKGEVQHLAADLGDKKLSAKAKRYIAGELKRLGTTTVNIVVEKSTAEALNAVVDKTNMVRDAFLNRLIMFLRSSREILRYLDLPENVGLFAFQSSVEPMPTSPMRAIEAVHSDPFYYLRVACEERFDTGLYLLQLHKLPGFACYLDDSQVPGTAAFAREQRDQQALLDELTRFEMDVFQKPDVSTEGLP